MTANRRIILNFVATYGRNLFSLVCGLFTGRWLLMGLGEVDYGLFGVVGGLTAFIVFFNDLMSITVSRYYAFYVGKAKTSSNVAEGIELCRKWFTTAVVVHTAIPVVLVAIGYPVGIWAVEHFLTIPAARISACIWVWRFSCFACFVMMITVPFSAMYTAKQEIAELTIYSFVRTTVNVVFMYYVVTHPGDWLARYAGWYCLILVLPQIILSVRAFLIYPECRFRFAYVKALDRFKELFVFAFLRFAGALAGMLQTQGMAILTNKFLGPSRNAAMTIGNTLSSQSDTLASALDGALSPAITNAAGAGDEGRMRSLCFRTCKFSTALMLVFALPLSLEVKEVMRLWLKNPPDYASELCVCMLTCLVLEKLATGHWMAIFAIGRIGWYQLWMGIVGLVSVPLAWALMGFNLDLLSVGYALVIGKILGIFVRMYFGWHIAKMSVSYWLKRIFLPITTASFIALAVGMLSCAFLPQSFLRIVITTALVEVVFLPIYWLLVLDREERQYFQGRLLNKLPFLRKR